MNIMSTEEIEKALVEVKRSRCTLKKNKIFMNPFHFFPEC